MTIYGLVDKTNYAAFKFNEQNKSIIDKICEPLLNKFDIEGFSYFKILSNGYGTNTSNQSYLNEIYCNYLCKEGVLYPDELKKPSLNRRHPFLWSRHAAFPKYKFPIATGMSLYKKYTDYYEVFVFQTLKIAPGLASLFLDNIDFLEMFGEYFKSEAKELIATNDPKKLVFIRDIDFSKYDNSESLNKIKQFLEEIKPTRLTIRTCHGGEILLSKRETDCMLILCTGRQHYKEIAQGLKTADRTIAPKTVETHIRRIRDKTGYYPLSDLIKAFDESFKYWSKLYYGD